MNLKQLATELTTEQVQELLARRMLIEEVEFTHEMVTDATDNETRAEYSAKLTSAPSLAEATNMRVDCSSVESNLFDKVSELAAEYTTKEAE